MPKHAKWWPTKEREMGCVYIAMLNTTQQCKQIIATCYHI